MVSYALRVFADMSCSGWSTMCRKSSDMLSHVYAVVICFMLIIAATKAQQVKELFGKLKAAFDLIVNDKAKKD